MCSYSVCEWWAILQVSPDLLDTISLVVMINSESESESE